MMNKLRNNSSWRHSVKIRLQYITDWPFLRKQISQICATRKIHLQYHNLLKQARENSLSSASGKLEQTREQEIQLRQLQTVREIYKRSIQRYFDFVILIIVLAALVHLTYLWFNQEPTVTIRLGIYSKNVNLHSIPPTWSMNGAEESDEIIYADEKITVSGIDTIEHNREFFNMTNESGFKLIPLTKDGLSGQVNLSNISFDNSEAQISFEVKNNGLHLSVGADRRPITIKGTLCKNGCFGKLIRDDGEFVLDSFKPINLSLEATGKKKLEIEFTKTLPEHHSSKIKHLKLKWEDIPLKDSITFTRRISDTISSSTIEAGWIYVFETNDTIRLGKHDFLHMKSANKSLVSVSTHDNELDENMLIYTEAIGKVNYLKCGPKELITDRMPRQIQVLAEMKDTLLFVTLLSLIATLFIPVILRNRL